jgi:hypothetical protein
MQCVCLLVDVLHTLRCASTASAVRVVVFVLAFCDASSSLRFCCFLAPPLVQGNYSEFERDRRQRIGADA